MFNHACLILTYIFDARMHDVCTAMGKFYGIVSAAAISDRDGNGSPVLGPSASLYTGKISSTLEATLLMSAASAMVRF